MTSEARSGHARMQVRCAACGAINRIPDPRPSRPARCGRCKAPLPVGGAPIPVTDATFEAIVARASNPVLLDCWAGWCQPCHMLAPTIDALARDYAGRLVVAKLDVDANPATASRFGIRSIPTLLLFRAGQLVDRLVGVQPRSEIESHIRMHLP